MRGGGRSPQGRSEISARRGPAAKVARDPFGPDEKELVQRSIEGDRDAFGALFRQNYTSIYRLARFYVDGADELASQTFARAWTELPNYAPGTPFASWLYKIGGDVVAEARAARLRAAFRELVPAGENDADVRALIAPLVALLPEDQRELIEMKYLLGMTDPEVATCFKKSIEAVDELRWQAIISMQELMERDG